jgi:hypothetical protein
MVKTVHLVICDLLLPQEIAATTCAGLHLPALEAILARGKLTLPAQAGESLSLEGLLCERFGMPQQSIASLSAAFDSLGGGCWLRADPVHLRLERDQMVLLPDPEIDAGEAAQLCAALNAHFAGEGMEFFAPHPARWYVRLDRLPDIETVPVSQAAGRNVCDLMPQGPEAARWRQIGNEIQMLLFAHPVNEAREARGALPVNSLWLWGGGGKTAASPQKNYACASSDDTLTAMFAAAAGIPFSAWSEQWPSPLPPDLPPGDSIGNGQLLVWTGLRTALRRGSLDAWRAALQKFETGYAQPLWQALRTGQIAQLHMEILGGDHARNLVLSRADAWAFWRRAKPLAKMAIG